MAGIWTAVFEIESEILLGTAIVMARLYDHLLVVSIAT